jgi:hypothetical protein
MMALGIYPEDSTFAIAASVSLKKFFCFLLQKNQIM